MTLPEIVTVNVAALKVDHLPVIDGQVREIVTLERVGDQVWIIYAATDTAPLDELVVANNDLMPCVRRAHWSTP